jgi:hypothetical protein
MSDTLSPNGGVENTPESDDSNQTAQRLILPLAIFGLFIVGLVVFLIYQASLLKMVSISPTTDKITTATTSLTIGFNKPLDNTGTSVVSSPVVISSYTVSGQNLTINFNAPMDANTKYTITIKSISSGGSKLTNKAFSFTPTPDTGLAQQPNIDQPNPGPYFTGTEALADYGLSPQQIGGIQPAFMKYKPSLKNVVVDTASILAVAHDPNSASPWDYVTFNVKVDDIQLSAKVGYSDITMLRLL